MDPHVVSVNISEQKGTIKIPVKQIELTETGVRGDAHSGKWHRQVSLLGTESFEKFEGKAGRKLAFGEFAENITTTGIILYQTRPLDRFIIGDTELEVTQIGKSCHGDGCAIYREVGNCVMPKEGIFCRVIKQGIVKAGDKVEYLPRTFKIKVVTLSDRAYNGEYPDRSGPAVTGILNQLFKDLQWDTEIENIIIPDEAAYLIKIIKDLNGTDILVTTGGTGIGPRDITIETVEPLLDKKLPGIMELIRVKYGQNNPAALLSRGVAGVIGKTLVYTLPGSVKAVEEYLSEINKTLKHSIYMLHGLDLHK
ncbi:MAG TPA: molybdenum cofactor synthesis domain-containing protein [Lentimicrobium sp.]|nr:molybdenum cofactor synthesis domain-containing protein [Lentimicrobium sp.]